MKYDSNAEEHHHFICNHCGMVFDIYIERFNYELDAGRSRLGKAKVDVSEIYLHGVCEDCLKR